MKFWRKPDAPKVAADVRAMEVMDAKDEQISRGEDQLATAKAEAKQSRVELNLVIRAGRNLRTAMDTAGGHFESAVDKAARRIVGVE